MKKKSSRQTNSKTGLTNSVIIVGIVRNVESSITKDFQRLTRAFSRFDKIDFFVVESGSQDRSIEILQKLSLEHENFNYEHLEIDHKLNRTTNMAAARNSYLNYLRDKSRFSDYSYVVVADFNNLNNKLDSHAVDSCWSKNMWDVVTANQSGRYYDVWALRHPIWSPNDCWEAVEFYKKYIKIPEVALSYSLRARSLRIPRNADWIEVDSAFGGLAIYKSELLKSEAFYDGLTSEGKVVCEHVPFHEQLRKLGARLFVNPALINTRMTDHTRRLSLLFTILRMFRYPVKLIKNLN